MADYRVTLYYQHAGLGGSETYIIAGASPTTIPRQAFGLVDQRRDFLPTAYDILGLRVADMGVSHLSYLYLPGETMYIDAGGNPQRLPSAGLYVLESTAGGLAHIRHTADIAVGWSTSNKATRFFSGVPRGVLDAEPGSLNQLAAPKWWEQMSQFMAGATLYPAAGPADMPRVSVLASTPSTALNTFPIAEWSLQQAAPSLIGLTITQATDPGWSVGTKIHVRDTRLVMPILGLKMPMKVSLNGVWSVSSVVKPAGAAGNYTYFLQGSLGVDPAWIKKRGTVQAVGSALQPLNFWAPRRAGVHARGKPASLPRGRRLTRLLLDP